MEALLESKLKLAAEQCTGCNRCLKQCGFLRRNGNPGKIAAMYDAGDRKYRVLPFECSLCGLCGRVCPAGLNPSDMFLEMRRDYVCRCGEDLPEHKSLLDYERRGTSRRYSYYAMPKRCDTVFFPGCTLTGTRPRQTLRLFDYLKGQIPHLGIVLDCCCKPSHDLGRDAHFKSLFHEMKDYLLKNGVKKVLAACPNCYQILKQYGSPIGLESVYEVMSRNGLPVKRDMKGSVCIHDPCAVRVESGIHEAVRRMVKGTGLSVVEMTHSREKTICCGEGGGACSVNPELAGKWSSLRAEEAGGRRIITYCAGCYSSLSKANPTSHIIDLMFEPEAALSDKLKVSRSPFTYLNRLRFKRRLKKTVDAAVRRERDFTAARKGAAVMFSKERYRIFPLCASGTVFSSIDQRRRK